MSIEVSPNGAITIDGPDIELARWITLRSALKLESKGIRMSRQMSALQVAKRNFGLTGSRATITASVEKRIGELEKERAARVAKGEG